MKSTKGGHAEEPYRIPWDYGMSGQPLNDRFLRHGRVAAKINPTAGYSPAIVARPSTVVNRSIDGTGSSVLDLAVGQCLLELLDAFGGDTTSEC
jgi:hypothetical protein